MLRKISMLGALVVVAVSFGVGNASAAPKKPVKPGAPPSSSSHGFWTDGFSDGRD
jgi:hypothetical protein